MLGRRKDGLTIVCRLDFGHPPYSPYRQYRQYREYRAYGRERRRESPTQNRPRYNQVRYEDRHRNRSPQRRRDQNTRHPQHRRGYHSNSPRRPSRYSRSSSVSYSRDRSYSRSRTRSHSRSSRRSRRSRSSSRNAADVTPPLLREDIPPPPPPPPQQTGTDVDDDESMMENEEEAKDEEEHEPNFQSKWCSGIALVIDMGPTHHSHLLQTPARKKKEISGRIQFVTERMKIAVVCGDSVGTIEFDESRIEKSPDKFRRRLPVGEDDDDVKSVSSLGSQARKDDAVKFLSNISSDAVTVHPRGLAFRQEMKSKNVMRHCVYLLEVMVSQKSYRFAVGTSSCKESNKPGEGKPYFTLKVSHFCDPLNRDETRVDCSVLYPITNTGTHTLCDIGNRYVGFLVGEVCRDLSQEGVNYFKMEFCRVLKDMAERNFTKIHNEFEQRVCSLEELTYLNAYPMDEEMPFADSQPPWS